MADKNGCSTPQRFPVLSAARSTGSRALKLLPSRQDPLPAFPAAARLPRARGSFPQVLPDRAPPTVARSFATSVLISARHIARVFHFLERHSLFPCCIGQNCSPSANRSEVPDGNLDDRRHLDRRICDLRPGDCCRILFAGAVELEAAQLAASPFRVKLWDAGDFGSAIAGIKCHPVLAQRANPQGEEPPTTHAASGACNLLLVGSAVNYRP